MDNFMDKIAQKLSGQDVIKANTSAEATEMKKLQVQVDEYEGILKSMRQVNLKSTEITTAMEEVLAQVGRVIADAKLETENALEGSKLQEEQLVALKELIETQFANQEKKTDVDEALTEFVHIESVKVYRNVQAVLVQGMKDQGKKVEAIEVKLLAQMKTIKTYAVVIAAVVAVDLIIDGVNLVATILNAMNLSLF